MAQEAHDPEAGTSMSRRVMLRSVGAAVGVAVLAPRLAGAQTPPSGPVAPPSTITSRPADFGPNGAPTTYFSDPDVLAVDPSFNGLGAAERARSSGCGPARCGAEGPAWSAPGRYLVWSDIPNNRQLRWIEDDGHVSVLPHAVEQQQRQHVRLPGPAALLRASDAGAWCATSSTARDGASPTTFDGKRLNSPNDVVPHPGRQLLVHRPAVRRPALRRHAGRGRAGPATAGRLNPRVGQPPEHRRDTSGSCRPQCYRVDPSGTLTHGGRRGAGAGSQRPLLLARLQEALRRQHRRGPGDTGAGGKGDVYVVRRGHGQQADRTGSCFTDFMVDGVKCGPDGVRCRRGRQSLVLEQCRPQGRLQRGHGVEPGGPSCIGRIRLPEVCGNVCFGGPKRNRLFMAASQSLYAVYTQTQGAAPG